MAKKGIDEMMNDLEDYVEHRKSKKFNSNVIEVQKDEMLNRIREVRIRLPGEIKDSTQVMQQKQSILDDANKQAGRIVDNARVKAQSMINDSEIMKQAQVQARELIKNARLQAQQMINQAQSEGDSIRIGALDYTNGVMKDLSDFTSAFLNEENSKYKQLVDSLSDAYKTIESNRAQITSQLNSGLAPGRKPAQKAEASADRRQVRDPGSQAQPMDRSSSQREEDREPVRRPGAPVPRDILPGDRKQERADRGAGQPAGRPSGRKEPSDVPPADEDLDELDEIYLDDLTS